jgi:hypothetical protein
MEKYKASDIIKRAKRLANIENTSFLSWREDMDYLNMAWKKVCQQLINKDTKYFYKVVDLPSSGTYELPDDFYQASSVRSKDGIVYSKKTASQPDNSSYWDIIGNQLIYSGGPAVLEYYTNPTYLTFPNSPIKLEDIDIDYTKILSVYGTHIVYEDDEATYAYDIDTGVSTKLFDTTGFTIYCGKNAFYHFGPCNIYSYNGNLLYRNQDLTQAAFDNYGNIYLCKPSDSKVEIYDYKDNVIKTIPVKNYTKRTAILLWDRNTDKLYQGATDITTQTVLDDYTGRTYPIFYNGVDSIISNTHIINSFTNDSIDLINPINLGLLSVDTDTGYGYLTSDGTDYYLESYMPDILLNFPNTLMFDYLAYQLAYYYGLKQNVDTTYLTSALSDAELSFFDSMDNGSTYGRIINVYNNGDF